MAYPGSGTTYPTQDNLDIQVNRTPVERDHWDNGAIAKQNWDYKYRRNHFINFAFPEIYSSSSTTEGSTYIEIPVTSALWTPDDYDTNCVASVRVNYRVGGGAGGANVGRVRVYLDDGAGPYTVDFDRVADPADAYAWETLTQNMAKLQANARVALVCYVKSGAANVCVRSLHIRFAVQGTIGV